VRDAQFRRRNAVAISTRASSHEAFSRARMHGLETDVAFLPFVSSTARLDRDRDGLLTFFVGVVLFGTAALFYLSTELVMCACFPVLLLAGRSTVTRLAAAALLGRVRQRDSAGGAVCEDHFGLSLRRCEVAW
jgi:hypothetical protein